MRGSLCPSTLDWFILSVLFKYTLYAVNSPVLLFIFSKKSDCRLLVVWHVEFTIGMLKVCAYMGDLQCNIV